MAIISKEESIDELRMNVFFGSFENMQKKFGLVVCIIMK